MIQHRPRGRQLELVVFDAGIMPATRSRLEASWRDDGVTIRWIPLDEASLTRCGLGFMAWAGGGNASMVLDLLLEEAGRILVLDADTLIVSDLTPLWETDLGSHSLAAVRDTLIPRIRDNHLPAELKALGPLPHFNAGVLLIDLPRWRREEIGPKARDFQRRFRDELWSIDQQALNWAVAGRWTPLSLSWNRMTHLLDLPAHSGTTFGRDELLEAIQKPRIVHFAGEDKPWNAACPDDRTPDFVAQMQRTAWAPWSPPRRGLRELLRDECVRRPDQRIQVVRRGLRLARREHLPKWPWYRSLFGIGLRYPASILSFPLLETRRRLGSAAASPR